jgi:predicted permease
MRERLAQAFFRAWLHLLPKAFRERVADELLEVFRSRRAAARGLRATLRAWTLELSGVLITAVRARLDDPLRLHPRLRSNPKGVHVERLLQDIRFAARFMTRRPSLTVPAVLTLGLGIAVSTAMFSVLDAVVLRPLPFPDPDELVSVYIQNPEFVGHPTMSEIAERGSLSYPEYRALREGSGDVLAGLAPLRLGSGGVIAVFGDESELIRGAGTDVDLFSRVLRVRPLLGRVFSDEDRSEGRPVLISEGLWIRRFAADPQVVGRSLYFETTPYTIIGVLPATAQLDGYPVEAWTLWGADERWNAHELFAIGRLAEGLSQDDAAERLSSVLASATPAGHTAHDVSVFPRRQDETRNVRGSIWMLALAALVLLGVACGNVAALQVGAGLDRDHELSLRAALGAGRGRLIGQLLAESSLLAVIAAGVGIALAGATTRLLVLFAPSGVPGIQHATLDARALVFAAATGAASAVLFGLVPAFALARAESRPAAAGTARARRAGRTRVQGALVVAELALATLMLVGAGLLGRTLIALDSTDLGFDADETLALRVTAPDSRLFAGVDMSDNAALDEAVDAFLRSLVEPLAALPGVRGVAITSVAPLTPDRGNNDVEPEGYTGETLLAERRFVSPNYFDVLGTGLVEGRSFTSDDDVPGAPGVVVVSESLARAAWPGESAVGKRLRYWDRDNVVVGVAEDIRDEEVQAGTALAFYAPRRQAGEQGGSLILRTDGPAERLVETVREVVQQTDRSVVINFARPLSDFASDHIASQRYRARLIVVFSLLATIFSLMGVYGITTRSVASRTRELGIRTALGARRDDLVTGVLGQALRLAAFGAVLGVGISFVVTRGIETYLWGVGRTDPLTLVGAALLLATASILSALAPALRAGRADPMQALRAE